jgi:hypothetical protein
MDMNNLEGQILEIIAKGRSKDEVHQYLTDIINRVLEEHKIIFQETRAPLEVLRKLVLARLEGSSIERKTQHPSNSKIPNLVFVSATESLYSIDRALSPPNTFPSYLVGDISIRKANEKQILLYSCSGLVFGFILGLNFIFLSEAIKKYRSRRSSLQS